MLLNANVRQRTKDASATRETTKEKTTTPTNTGWTAAFEQSCRRWTEGVGGLPRGPRDAMASHAAHSVLVMGWVEITQIVPHT